MRTKLKLFSLIKEKEETNPSEDIHCSNTADVNGDLCVFHRRVGQKNDSQPGTNFYFPSIPLLY